MWSLLVPPSQQDHPREWRCKSEQVFSVHAPACMRVQWAWPGGWLPVSSPRRLTYEPGETRAAETSDGSISATPSVSSTSSSRSVSSVQPQPLTRQIPSKPRQDSTRPARCGGHSSWHSGCFSPRRSPGTLRWQRGWCPLEITETRILLRRIRSQLTFRSSSRMAPALLVLLLGVVSGFSPCDPSVAVRVNLNLISLKHLINNVARQQIWRTSDGRSVRTWAIVLHFKTGCLCFSLLTLFLSLELPTIISAFWRSLFSLRNFSCFRHFLSSLRAARSGENQLLFLKLRKTREEELIRTNA